MFAHQAADLLGIHDHAAMAKFGPYTPVAISFELVANRFHLGDNSDVRDANNWCVIERRAADPHQSAPFGDRDPVGPTMTDVVAFRGRGAFLSAPFRNSISRACRPTIRSNAAILASYSCRSSAAWASSSKAPASYFCTQTRINWRERSCLLARPYRVSPATNSCATCRLNSMLCERCLAMAFILRKPRSTCQIRNLNLSGSRGALQIGAETAFATATSHAGRCRI